MDGYTINMSQEKRTLFIQLRIWLVGYHTSGKCGIWLYLQDFYNLERKTSNLKKILFRSSKLLF